MTDTATKVDSNPAAKVQHFDVLIVGAGISGIGGAYHLADQCPMAVGAGLGLEGWQV